MWKGRASGTLTATVAAAGLDGGTEGAEGGTAAAVGGAGRDTAAGAGAGAEGVVLGSGAAGIGRFGSRIVSIRSAVAPASVSRMTASTERSKFVGEERICCVITDAGTWARSIESTLSFV